MRLCRCGRLLGYYQKVCGACKVLIEMRWWPLLQIHRHNCGDCGKVVVTIGTGRPRQWCEECRPPKYVKVAEGK